MAAAKKTIKFSIARDGNEELYLYPYQDLNWEYRENSGDTIWVNSKDREGERAWELCDAGETIVGNLLSGRVPLEGRVYLTLTVDSIDVPVKRVTQYKKASLERL